MRQSIFELILHQPTPDAIIAQIEGLQSLARLEAADDALDGFLADLVALQVHRHDLGVAHSADDLCDAIVRESVLREGEQTDVAACGPQALAQVDGVHVAERAVREVQVACGRRFEKGQKVALLLGRDPRLLLVGCRGD